MIVSAFMGLNTDELIEENKGNISVPDTHQYLVWGGWPDRFVDEVIEAHEEGRVVLCPALVDVLKELFNRGYHVNVVYPSMDSQEHYLNSVDVLPAVVRKELSSMAGWVRTLNDVSTLKGHNKVCVGTPCHVPTVAKGFYK